MPTRSSAAITRSFRSDDGMPLYVSGSSTFSKTVRSPIRLNAWKTNPISRLRTRARSDADKEETSLLSSRYWPSVGESSNVEAAVAGFPVVVDEARAAAPPSTDPDAGTLLGVPLAPVATVGAITGDVQAGWATSPLACVPAVDGERVLSDARTTLAGLDLADGAVAEVGASDNRTTTKLVADSAITGDVAGDDMVSRVETTVADVSLLAGTVQIDVTGDVVVEARSDGTTGEGVVVDQPTVVATVGPTTTPIPLNGQPVDIAIPHALHQGLVALVHCMSIPRVLEKVTE